MALTRSSPDCRRPRSPLLAPLTLLAALATFFAVVSATGGGGGGPGCSCGPPPDPYGYLEEVCAADTLDGDGDEPDHEIPCWQRFEGDRDLLMVVARHFVEREWHHGVHRGCWCDPGVRHWCGQQLRRCPVCGPHQRHDRATRTCVHRDGYRYADPQHWMLNGTVLLLVCAFILLFSCGLAVRAERRVAQAQKRQ